jgi:glycosyltransferase involved in cell wall biosynthesis
MKKIRLAIMADEFDRRPERTLAYRHLIEDLIKTENIELTLVHSDPMPDEPIYKRVREVVMPRVHLPWGSHFTTFLRYCLTTKDEYDIVYYFKARLFPFFWLFPAMYTVVLAHGGGERLAPGRWTVPRFVFVWNLILFQKYIDAIIGVSEYANKEIIYAFRMPPEKVHTIYTYLDDVYAAPPSDETVRTALATYGLERENYFTYIGRFRIHKNVGNLVAAYLRYREQNPHATERLALGGGTKEEYEKVFGRLPDSPFVKDIRFFGYIPTEHMPVLYTGARALAFVTLNEGFGVPIIEAMACGTPVITSSVTSMPEVAGDAALIVDPRNPQALADAFALVSRNEALRAELIHRGHKRARFFTREKMFQGILGIYRGLMEVPASVYNPVSDTDHP